MAKPLSSFAKYVRTEAPECPDVMILDAILRSGIEFCKRTRCIKEVIPVTTSANTPRYVLATSEDYLPELILDVKREYSDSLDASSQDEFSHFRWDVELGPPNYYYMEGKSIVLGMIPEGIEELTVTLAIRPDNESTTLPDELYDRYVEKIAYGAKARLMAMVNKPWSDMEGAALNNGLFEDAIANATVREFKGGSRNNRKSRPRFF